MSTTRERVAERLRGAFPDADVEVVDLTGSDDHLEARVVSAAFEGKSRIERHKLVYAPLRVWIQDETIHALSIRAWTPGQHVSHPTEGTP
ncbi:MAG: BolA family protein [Gemmatimonadota bacterium]